MKVSFGENYSHSNVFRDIKLKTQTVPKPCLNQPSTDKFEFQSIKEKIKKNKKFIIGFAIAAGALLTALLIKKNQAAVLKEGKAVLQNGVQNLENNVQNNVQIPQKTITSEMVENAKTFLIKDVAEHGEASVNGICFYGPNSIGKEETIKSFLGDLEKAGYKIEQAPRAKETPLNEISSAIVDLIHKAEERFKTTKQRTAIVVRDLDQIASDRNLSGGKTSSVVSSLIKMQDCRKRGFTWIAEAVDITKADNAVTRMGRMEHQIVTIPSIKDDISVWNKYIDLIKRFKDSPKRDNLLAEAQEILNKKGIL